jgi:hypothetical protein
MLCNFKNIKQALIDTDTSNGNHKHNKSIGDDLLPSSYEQHEED